MGCYFTQASSPHLTLTAGIAPAVLELEFELEQAEIMTALNIETPTQRVRKKYCFAFIEVLQEY